jgi:hypothetical protein
MGTARYRSPHRRNRKLTISGSDVGSVLAAEIKAQIPRYIELIADGSVQVPFRTLRLSDTAIAWAASAEPGPRVARVGPHECARELACAIASGAWRRSAGAARRR